MEFANRTIGELVADDYRLATVFKKHGIDFCCGGGRTVEEACQKKGLALEALTAELEAVDAPSPADGARPDRWELDFLADYIVNQHHGYVRETIPLLQEFTHKVARVHGHANPEVVEIARRFDALAAEMTAHMAKEEQILFPYIRKMVAHQKGTGAKEQPVFGTVRNPVRMMEHEHDSAGALMREIRELSADFTPPEHACNTYRVAFAKLEEFEGDLHRHVHLENNILFPKAIALEERIGTHASA